MPDRHDDNPVTYGPSWEAKKAAWARAHQLHARKSRPDPPRRERRELGTEERVNPRMIARSMSLFREAAAEAERRGRKRLKAAHAFESMHRVQRIGQRTIDTARKATRLAVATALLPLTLARLAFRRTVSL